MITYISLHSPKKQKKKKVFIKEYVAPNIYIIN